MNWSHIADQATQVAEETAELLRRALGAQVKRESKSSSIDIVTEADQNADRHITERLNALFPEHSILAEESGQHGQAEGLRWLVDPLDGTTNFAHRIPHFGVSMALYDGPRAMVAVTVDPIRRETFRAVRGEGAYLNGSPIRVSPVDDLVQAVLATGFPYDRHQAGLQNIRQMEAFLRKVRGVRRMGSCTLDMAYVACGRYDGFWEYKLAPWDVAAGVLLIEEAGGKVTDINGDPLKLNEKIHFCVSNGHLHPAMLEVIREFA